MKSRSCTGLFFVVVFYFLFLIFNDTLYLVAQLFNGRMGIIPVLQGKKRKECMESENFLHHLDLCSEVEKF